MAITRTFNQDYSFGKANEVKSLPILNNFFKVDLVHIQDQYAPFDFESSKYAIEQKSRNCSVRDYPTTMLQYRKILNCNLPSYKEKEKWFIFRFTDGLYGIKYDENAFKKYIPILTKVQDRVGITEKDEPRIFIDINDLVFLAKLNSSGTSEEGTDARVIECLID
jgi:hypothetical protein